MKILVINGPNLNMLGSRDPNQYGNTTLNAIEMSLIGAFSDVKFEFIQSNLEGEIINKIQSAPSYFDGLIINPGGYAHTSVAVRDALELCKIPKVEVHLSNLTARESFRQNLITASACDGYISGFKELGYSAAVYLIQRIIKNQ